MFYRKAPRFIPDTFKASSCRVYAHDVYGIVTSCRRHYDRWASISIDLSSHTHVFKIRGVIVLLMRFVKAALKRGVEYGILRRYRGHYFLPTGDELDRANRIAIRFAKLPTPAPTTFAKSKIKSRKIKDSKRPQGIDNRMRKSKKVEKTHSPTVSASSSLTDEIVSDIASATE
ncbi:hypothetical protein ALC53_09691 [Atta colombica]|uniref:Uncharacterized protein n=1 Tax=Atta colombica TaxID=520822 RepID=A0A195B6G0_9HYME|nr:hypothetical protein ALC53_09691 [Atta colombica]